MQTDTLAHCLEHWVKETPDRVWLRDLREGGGEYTWAQAQTEIHAAGAALEKRFGHGTRMLVLSRNCPHWFFADLAIIGSGNVTVPLFTTHPPATAGYIAEFTESKVIFVGESPNWETIRPAMPEGITVISLPGAEVAGADMTWAELIAEGEGSTPEFEGKSDDVVSLVFTSGTTGLPKGVIQTHDSSIVPIRRAFDYLDMMDHPTPRYFSYLPLSHIAERQIVEYSSMQTGGEVFFIDALEHLARDMAKARPHVFFGAPRVWEQLQGAVINQFGGQEAFDAAMASDTEGVGKLVLGGLGLDEVKVCLVAAAPTPPPLLHWWHALGLMLVEGFGQTEAMALILSKEDSWRIGSVGKAMDGVDVRLTEEDELVVRADGFTPGYYKNPEKTDELIKDGWLYTGDKARIDDDGFIYITGRVKDYFKTIQGKFVAPPPIEGAFAESHLVEQQCLMGRGLSKTVMVAVLSEAGKSEDQATVESALSAKVAEINDTIEKHARIGALILSTELWAIENEILTPTLKIRREKIEERFGELAAELARSAAEQRKLLLHWD